MSCWRLATCHRSRGKKRVVKWKSSHELFHFHTFFSVNLDWSIQLFHKLIASYFLAKLLVKKLDDGQCFKSGKVEKWKSGKVGKWTNRKGQVVKWQSGKVVKW